MFPKSFCGLRCLVIIAGVCLVMTAAAQDKPSIDVITSDAWPLSGVQVLKKQGYTVNVYNLDDGKRLVKRLARGLPPNQQAAVQRLQATFRRLGKDRLRAEFMQAFQAQIISTQYGLTRYPAVVFDHGGSVVYGVTDLPAALRRYRAWRRSR